MTEFNPQIIALKLALKDMFSKKYFNISTIDSCLKITGAVPDGKIYEIMRAVHCIHFEDMDKPFRDWLFKESVLMISSNGFDFDELDIFDTKSNIEICEKYQILE